MKSQDIDKLATARAEVTALLIQAREVIADPEQWSGSGWTVPRFRPVLTPISVTSSPPWDAMPRAEMFHAVCAAHALYDVAHTGCDRISSLADSAEYRQAMRLLAKATGYRGGGSDHSHILSVVGCYNDSHSHDDVMAMFDRAIELSRAV